MEKLDKILKYLKENYGKKSYRIKTEEAKGLTVFDSKFGGCPYWPKGMDYPKGTDGENLVLLAQINFDEFQPKDGLMPEGGMLQFYIANEDLYGMNFDDATKQDNFRVVYHESIDGSVSEEKVKALGVKANTDLTGDDDLLPFYKEFKLTFDEQMEAISIFDCNYDAALAKAVDSLFGETLEGSAFTYFEQPEYEYMTKDDCGWGHKMLGYPAFTQEDPRSEGDEFDTLLLQVDSDNNDIIWGDTGICNFFISEKALKDKDFSKVIYNWDCY